MVDRAGAIAEFFADIPDAGLMEILMGLSGPDDLLAARVQVYLSDFRQD